MHKVNQIKIESKEGKNESILAVITKKAKNQLKRKCMHYGRGMAADRWGRKITFPTTCRKQSMNKNKGHDNKLQKPETTDVCIPTRLYIPNGL